MARKFNQNSANFLRRGSVATTATNNWSWFVQFKLNAYDGSNSQFFLANGHGGSYGEGYGVLVRTDGDLGADFYYVAGYDSGLHIRPKQLSRAVVSRDSTTLRSWLNGKRSTATITNSPFGPGLYYSIGDTPDQDGNGESAFNGDIEKVFMWTRALTHGEALALTTGRVLPENMRGAKLVQANLLTKHAGDDNAFYAGGTVAQVGSVPQAIETRSEIQIKRFLQFGMVPQIISSFIPKTNFF